MISPDTPRQGATAASYPTGGVLMLPGSGERSPAVLVAAVTIAFVVSAVGCQTSAEQEARAITDRQAQIGAVQTQTALMQEQQGVEAQATQVAANATAAAQAGPARGTATALAQQAQTDALATRAVLLATATVAAAEVGAEAEATRIVAVSAAQAAVEATQTVTVQQAGASRAAWIQRRDAAALYVFTCAKAADIASATDSIQAAITSAQKQQDLTQIRTCSDTPALEGVSGQTR
jgi:hypothetical protein